MLAEKINRVALKVKELGQALGPMGPTIAAELEQAEDLARQLEGSLQAPTPDHEVLMDARLALSELSGKVGSAEWERVKGAIDQIGKVQRSVAKLAAATTLAQ